MGVCVEEFAANVGGENGIGSCQAHLVSISPQEDRGGTKGKVGEVPGAEESGVGRRTNLRTAHVGGALGLVLGKQEDICVDV
jgi:hypothetical protein